MELIKMKGDIRAAKKLMEWKIADATDNAMREFREETEISVCSVEFNLVKVENIGAPADYVCVGVNTCVDL